MAGSSEATLVFAFGALGDSVLLWPMLRALRPLTLIAPSEKARLPAQWVEGVHPLDGDGPAFARLFAPDPDHPQLLPESARAPLRRASRIISFVSVGADAWARNVRRLNPEAELHCLRARPAEERGEIVPIVEHHRVQLAERGLPLDPVDPAPRRNSTGPIVVHPGSGGRAKCWPPECFERLIGHLEAANQPIRVLLGEAELERMDPRRLESWRQRFPIDQPPDLPALGERLAAARLFIGNDSGPTHLAAQLGGPTIALFGPTDPRVWAPRGPAVTVLAPSSPRPMDWLKADRVEEAVEHALASGAGAGAEPGALS
jgi:hypothetical protein